MSKEELDWSSGFIERGSRVLELSCGSGNLLLKLARELGADVKGVEESEHLVAECIAKHLSVIQGTYEEVLPNFPDSSFDYVIHSSPIALNAGHGLIEEMLRVGQYAAIRLENFAYLPNRLRLLVMGSVDSRAESFSTLTDFKKFCIQRSLKITKAAHFGNAAPKAITGFLPELLAKTSYLLISR